MRTAAVLVLAFAGPLAAAAPVSLFNGKDFTGWEGDTANTWRVEDGCVVGGSLEAVVPRNDMQ